MPQYGRLVAVILEVSDLDRSAALYRNAFGIDFHPGDNGVDDRWTGGRHAETSWREGAYLHFALYPAKEQPTSGVQVTLSVENIDVAHTRQPYMQAHTSFTDHVQNLGAVADAMRTLTATWWS